MGVTLPAARIALEPLMDDLTTLAPGFKVAVYPSGKVEVVKDENYVETVLDKANNPGKKRKLPKAAKSVEELAVEDDSADEDTDGDVEDVVADDSDDEEAMKKVKKTKKKSGKDDESSEDEGDGLENEYIQELELAEEEEVEKKDQVVEEVEGNGQVNEEPPAKKAKKVTKAVAAKKSNEPTKKPTGKKAVKPNA